jgi:cell division protein FtsW
VKRGQLESHLLILVTLGLVAFGLVMVYSATSASAALANGDPSYYLKRQALDALLGVAL